MSPPTATPYRMAVSIGLMAWHLQSYWAWYCARLATVDRRDMVFFFLLQLPTLVPAFLVLADLQISSLQRLALLTLSVTRRALWTLLACPTIGIAHAVRGLAQQAAGSSAASQAVADVATSRGWRRVTTSCLAAIERLVSMLSGVGRPQSADAASPAAQRGAPPLENLHLSADLLRVILLPEPRPPQPAACEDQACIICLTNARAVCAVPCGHAHFCHPCLLSQIINVRPCCPSCNAPIREVIYVYQ